MSSDNDNDGADISAKVAGQEVNIKNIKSVNTIFTLLGFALTCLIAFMLFEHRNDERGARHEFILAIKELTGAQRETTSSMREQNCLLSLPQDQRQAQMEFCKRISR